MSAPRKFSFLGNYDPQIFWPILIVFSFIIGCSILWPLEVGTALRTVQNAILSNGSFFIVTISALTAFTALWLALSKWKDVRLGGPDARPEFSFYAWIMMLFCTGLGTGFVIYGSAEPLYHLFTGTTLLDKGIQGSWRGVPEAIRFSVIDWGLLAFPLFAVCGWAIGYGAYNHDKPLRTSSGLYGLLGDKCNSHILGRLVDILGAVASIGGVTMMIGLGIASITYAVKLLFGITLSGTGQLTVMLVFIAMYITSSATGLKRGIRILSESTGYMAIFLLICVLFLGAAPFTYIADLFLQNLGEITWRLPEIFLYTDAEAGPTPRGWHDGWPVFYILWNISYVPFTSGFLARISRGRTLREYIIGASLTPIVMCLIWFTTWGGNSCYLELSGQMQIWAMVQNNAEQALYLLLQTMPFGTLLSFVAFVAFVFFAVTTADSASFFIAQQTDKFNESPSLGNRVVWGLVIGTTGIILQIIGGFQAIKSLAIAGGSVFLLVVLAYLLSVVKMMYAHKD